MPTPRTSPAFQLQCTAYHEAGHVVAGIALGRRVEQVVLLPGAEADASQAKGRTVFAPWEDSPIQQPGEDLDSQRRYLSDVIEREVMTFLGGLVAERWFRERSSRRKAGAARKRKSLKEGPGSFRPSEEVKGQVTSALMERTRDLLLKVPPHLLAVDNIAAELVAKLEISGREAESLYERALLEGEPVQPYLWGLPPLIRRYLVARITRGRARRRMLAGRRPRPEA
jgi:hypothetical protein